VIWKKPIKEATIEISLSSASLLSSKRCACGSSMARHLALAIVETWSHERSQLAAGLQPL
jgi:hypothetical protein